MIQRKISGENGRKMWIEKCETFNFNSQLLNSFECFYLCLRYCGLKTMMCKVLRFTAYSKTSKSLTRNNSHLLVPSLRWKISHIKANQYPKMLYFLEKSKALRRVASSSFWQHVVKELEKLSK